MAEYLLRVDDNFHYMDKDYRTTAGEFDTWDEALAKAKSIVDDYLLRDIRGNPGISAELLYQRYTMFGEDPYIIGSDDREFSAWTYAEQRCQALCSRKGEV